MKYLKLFKTAGDYQNYINSDDCIKPNVSYLEDTDNLYYNPRINLPDNPSEDEDFIILTYESNPAVMDICYYQGWAASPDVMKKSEAEKVTDIGTAFQGLQGNTNTYGYGTYGYGSDDLTEEFTSFDEFKYFTGVTSISESAFEDCSRLTSIVIPDSVTSIGSSAFSYCSRLTSIIIPNSVTSIGSEAFDGCSSLTSVTLGSSVISIDSSAFKDCSALTSIIIPDSVTTIGSYAFYACSQLAVITFGDSITTIGRSAFQYCNSDLHIKNPVVLAVPLSQKPVPAFSGTDHRLEDHKVHYDPHRPARPFLFSHGAVPYRTDRSIPFAFPAFFCSSHHNYSFIL